MEVASRIVILLLLTVKKTVSSQWPSACSVNNADERGNLGAVLLPRTTSNHQTYCL